MFNDLSLKRWSTAGTWTNVNDTSKDKCLMPLNVSVSETSRARRCADRRRVMPNLHQSRTRRLQVRKGISSDFMENETNLILTFALS